MVEEKKKAILKSAEYLFAAKGFHETTVADIEKSLQDKGLKEIPSTIIGEDVMDHLHLLDEVAYVRFASVYRSFKDINEFMTELKDILGSKEIKALKEKA